MKIFIGTPSYESKLDRIYVMSLLTTIDIVRLAGHQISWGCVPNALVERARNRLCAEAIRQQVDYFWMIDDDTGWDAAAVRTMLTLMEEGVPFIAGAPPRRSYPIRFTVRLEKGEPHYVAGCRVKQCVTGCVAFAGVKLEVFKAIEQLCPEYIDNGERQRLFFEQRRVNVPGEEDLRLLGEDESFSLLVRRMGIEIVCPIDMKLTHRGSHEFVASLGEEWDRPAS